MHFDIRVLIFLFNRYHGLTDAPDNDSDDERVLCWENTVLFLVSCYQYLILGVVYSKGLPYRQPIYTNGMILRYDFILLRFSTNQLNLLCYCRFIDHNRGSFDDIHDVIGNTAIVILIGHF